MTARGNGAHAPEGLLARYAAGDAGIGPETLWALEGHLEGCASCRDRLADAVRGGNPGTVSLLERVHAGLDTELARSAPAPLRSRLLPRTSRWLAPTLLRWLGMSTLMVLTAVGFDLVNDSSRMSLVLLLAPVVPLLGVAAVWARGQDPVHELVAATPRAGLYLVLRRTLTVLVVVIPVLALAGLVVDASPARWLLPCLAFTAGALALGTVIGVSRAAAALGLLWAAGVIAPSLVTARLPAVLDTASLPAWAALTAATAVVLVLRRDAYTKLPSSR